VLAQNDSEVQAVKTAAFTYIEAFYEGDTAKVRQCILPSVNKLGYYKAREAKNYIPMPMSFNEMMDYATNVRRSNRQIPTNVPRDVVVLDVQDQTASAKISAWWGTDYLLLGKYNGQWKIVHVLWQSKP